MVIIILEILLLVVCASASVDRVTISVVQTVTSASQIQGIHINCQSNSQDGFLFLCFSDVSLRTRMPSPYSGWPVYGSCGAMISSTWDGLWGASLLNTIIGTMSTPCTTDTGVAVSYNGCTNNGYFANEANCLNFTTSSASYGSYYVSTKRLDWENIWNQRDLMSCSGGFGSAVYQVCYPKPTDSPTMSPTKLPTTNSPTEGSTGEPTENPTNFPSTSSPTIEPSMRPSKLPFGITMVPSNLPSSGAIPPPITNSPSFNNTSIQKNGGSLSNESALIVAGVSSSMGLILIVIACLLLFMRRRQSTKVFISYSQRDTGGSVISMVDLLRENSGLFKVLEIMIDLESIHDLSSITSLIEDSDVIVCVLTPEYLSSDWCIVEIEKSFELSKPVIPIVFSQPSTILSILSDGKCKLSVICKERLRKLIMVNWNPNSTKGMRVYAVKNLIELIHKRARDPKIVDVLQVKGGSHL
jgi:hypothetical protein